MPFSERAERQGIATLVGGERSHGTVPPAVPHDDIAAGGNRQDEREAPVNSENVADLNRHAKTIRSAIAERLALELDVAALRAEYDAIARDFRPVIRNAGGYVGWSVTSSDGDYRDGWTDYSPVAEAGGLHDAPADRGALPVGAERHARSWADRKNWIGWKPERTYTLPTAVCRGAIAEAVEAVLGSGLEIARVRIAVLRAGRELVFHQEARPDTYFVRLHIPIVTNAACFFVTAYDRVHLPADGAGYLVAVNQRHKAINHGRADRAHLMMTIWDPAGVSQHHRLDDPAFALAERDGVYPEDEE